MALWDMISRHAVMTLQLSHLEYCTRVLLYILRCSIAEDKITNLGVVGSLDLWLWVANTDKPMLFKSRVSTIQLSEVCIFVQV